MPVDDVEEFFVKSQQVGAANSKAIVITSNAFQSGALAFARSKKMGLARYFYPHELKWELRRSASASFGRFDALQNTDIVSALTQEDYRSAVFDLFMQSPKKSTNALWDFFEDLIVDTDFDKGAFRALYNPRGRQPSLVPFLQKLELESLADDVLELVGYEQGYVNLEQICSRHPTAKDLRVERLPLPGGDSPNTPLGRINFEPLKIELFTLPNLNVGAALK